MTAFAWQQKAVSTPFVSKAISVPAWGEVLQPYEWDRVLTPRENKPTVRSGALETNEIQGELR